MNKKPLLIALALTVAAAAALEGELSSVKREVDGDVAVEAIAVVLSGVTSSLPG